MLGLSEKDVFDLLNEEVSEESQSSEEVKVSSESVDDLMKLYDHNWKGTGDVVNDLVLWLDNEKSLPSEDLSAYSGNFKHKAKVGMYLVALKTISMLPGVLKYKEEAEKIVFDIEGLADIETEDLLDRLEKANNTTLKMMDNVRRILATIDSMEGDEKEESDRLRMLLASLPKNKIRDLLEKLQ